MINRKVNSTHLLVSPVGRWDIANLSLFMFLSIIDLFVKQTITNVLKVTRRKNYLFSTP